MRRDRTGGFWGRVAVVASSCALVGVFAVFPACRDVVAVQPAKRCELQIVTLDVITAKTINPSAEGEPRPVQLRIYQLASDVRLQNATFEEIWKHDAETLHDDLTKVDELSVFPESRTEVRFERDQSAQAVVVVALFRNPKGRSWYASFELPPAPGKGTCGAPCEGEGCDAGPNLEPRYAVWIEGTRVDNGDEHLDEAPAPGRTQVVNLKAKPAPSSAPAPAASQK